MTRNIKDIIMWALGISVLFYMVACGPIKDNQRVPEPAPDHGADMSVSDCVKPYLLIKVIVLSDDSHAYAANRPLNVVVSGSNLDGRPWEYEDVKTGKKSHFIWHTDPKLRTEEMKPYFACVEYLVGQALAFTVSATVTGKLNDWVSMEISNDKDPNRNICVDPTLTGDDEMTGLQEYAQTTIHEGDNGVAIIHCLVPAVGI